MIGRLKSLLFSDVDDPSVETIDHFSTLDDIDQEYTALSDGVYVKITNTISDVESDVVTVATVPLIVSMYKERYNYYRGPHPFEQHCAQTLSQFPESSPRHCPNFISGMHIRHIPFLICTVEDTHTIFFGCLGCNETEAYVINGNRVESLTHPDWRSDSRISQES